MVATRHHAKRNSRRRKEDMDRPYSRDRVRQAMLRIREQRDIECIAQTIEDLNAQKKELKKKHREKIKGMR